MGIVLWVLAGLLAAVFLGAGAMKALRSRAQLQADPRMTWTEDFAPATIKAIGWLEVLAAVGLILPGLTGILPVLVGLAAAGLVVVMVGAIVTHARRGERQALPMNVVLLVLAAVVAWGRLGPYRV